MSLPGRLRVRLGRRLRSGCAAGCAVAGALAVAAILLLGGYCRPMVRAVREAERQGRALDARFGPAESFAPWSDGTIPLERIELFVRIRRGLEDPADHLESVLATLPPDALVAEGSTVFERVTAAGSALRVMVVEIAGYLAARDRVLAEAGMGLGEYLYLYTTASYSFLGHPPDDGPRVTRRLPSGSDRRPGERLFGADHDRFGSRPLWRRYRRLVLTHSRNSFDGAAPVSEWTRVLGEELARFEEDPGAVLWERGLPPGLAATLERWRPELEATYRPALNCFELSYDPW